MVVVVEEEEEEKEEEEEQVTKCAADGDALLVRQYFDCNWHMMRLHLQPAAAASTCCASGSFHALQRMQPFDGSTNSGAWTGGRRSAQRFACRWSCIRQEHMERMGEDNGVPQSSIRGN